MFRWHSSQFFEKYRFRPPKKPGYLHPVKLTRNLKMNPWKRRFLLKTIIFRFHISFRGGGGNHKASWTCRFSYDKWWLFPHLFHTYLSHQMSRNPTPDPTSLLDVPLADPSWPSRRHVVGRVVFLLLSRLFWWETNRRSEIRFFGGKPFFC